MPGNNAAHLTSNVTPVWTTTVADGANVDYRNSAQAVTLTARLGRSGSGVVNGGTVQFRVDGIGTVEGPVVNGSASAVLMIPAAQPPGAYRINAVYSGTASLPGSSDSNRSLLVAVKVTVTAAAAASIYSTASRSVTLMADVTGEFPANPQPTITFDVGGIGSATSGIAAGLASATLVIPGGTAAGVYPITAFFTPPAAGSNTGNTLTVAKATPPLTWAAPPDIVYGAAWPDSVKNASSSVPGTFGYFLPVVVMPFGAFPAVGTHTLSANFTPADSANYTTATVTTTAKVLPEQLVITVASLARDPATNEVVADVTFTNTAGQPYGNSLAIRITQADMLGKLTTSTIASPAATLAPGASTTLSLRFPATVAAGRGAVGVKGTAIVSNYSGTILRTDNYSSTIRVTVP